MRKARMPLNERSRCKVLWDKRLNTCSNCSWWTDIDVYRAFRAHRFTFAHHKELIVLNKMRYNLTRTCNKILRLAVLCKEKRTTVGALSSKICCTNLSLIDMVCSILVGSMNASLNGHCWWRKWFQMSLGEGSLEDCMCSILLKRRRNVW